MKYQRIFLSLTFLSIIIYKFECTAHVCENFGIYETSGLSEEDTICGEDDICCNSNILQEMRTTFEQAKKQSYQDGFKKLVKSFKILSKEIKASHIMLSPQLKEYQQTTRQIVSTHNRNDGEDIYNALQHLACNISQNPESIARLDSRVITTLKNAKCICKHPIVKNLVEERAGIITSIYTNYKDGFVQLTELTTKINLVGKGSLEDELLEKQLKAIVCKQCSGRRKPICMSECHELVNLDMTFEAKKLQLLEGIVKLVKERIEQVSTLSDQFNLEFVNAKQSIINVIAAQILEGRDFNEDCEKGDENSNIDVGGSCSAPPTKCNSANKASCTTNNCGNQCMVNCCNGSSKSKCTIPTCVGCKGTAAATCLENTKSLCPGITQTQSRINVEKITELLYSIQDQLEESKRNLGTHGRYICQQLMDTHDDINLIEECNEREFGGDFDKIMSEEFSEEQTQYYSDADQPINDALNELGLFW